MDISLLNSLNFIKQNNVVKNKYNKFSQYTNLSPLKCDKVSFSGMKKSQFSGLDLVVVEKFKAPIDKFKTKEDFEKWMLYEIDTRLAKDPEDMFYQQYKQRKDMINEWKNYIQEENRQYSTAEQLLIFDMITKVDKNDIVCLPPILNKGVLAHLFYDIKNALKTKDTNGTKSYANGLNLEKLYTERLKNFVLEEGSSGDNCTKWIVIPSKEHDPEHFEENVKKLQILSCNSWCTKSSMAEPYLKYGDFHLYVENGKTKVAIRFYGNEIAEIQGKLNNSQIPIDYAKKVSSYITKGKYKLGIKAKKEMNFYEENKDLLLDLNKLIKKKDNAGILRRLGFRVSKNKDGMLILSNYKKPFPNLSFADLGIVENQLLSNVVEIKGNADFRDSELTSLGKIKKIGGNAIFSCSKITDLSDLTEIGRNAYFRFSDIDDLKHLKKIGGNIFCSRVLHEYDFGDLEHIGGDAILEGVRCSKPTKIKYIGGDAVFSSAMISLDNLETINSRACFDYATILSIPKLKHVGSKADFDGANIKNHSDLIVEYIKDKEIRYYIADYRSQKFDESFDDIKGTIFDPDYIEESSDYEEHYN